MSSNRQGAWGLQFERETNQFYAGCGVDTLSVLSQGWALTETEDAIFVACEGLWGEERAQLWQTLCALAGNSDDASRFLSYTSFRMGFAATFLISWLSSGLLLGMASWFFVRDEGLDRIDRWIAHRDQLLQHSRVPVLFRSARWMWRPIARLYGRSVTRRITTSLTLGLVYCLMCGLGIGLLFSPNLKKAREARAQLEAVIDPSLLTLPPIVIQDSLKTRVIASQAGSITVPFYEGQPWEGVRKRIAAFELGLLARIAESRDRTSLGVARLLDGPRFGNSSRVGSFLSIWSLYALLDCLAAMMALAALRGLARRQSKRSVLVAFVWAPLGAVAMAAFSAVNIQYLLLGEREIVWQCFGILFAASLVMLSLAVFREGMDDFKKLRIGISKKELSSIAFALLACIGFAASGICLFAGIFMNSSLVLAEAWRAILSMDRITIILAGTTAVPLMITLLFVIAASTVHAGIETMRLLLISFHGWARASGTTYVGLWIGVISAILAGGIALATQSNN